MKLALLIPISQSKIGSIPETERQFYEHQFSQLQSQTGESEQEDVKLN